MSTEYSFMKTFESMDDLEIYGDNALLLFALAITRNIDDIHAVAAQSLTDGSDDKKCDLVYVDSDKRTAIIAQGYYSAKKRACAPANKASDLNTAVSWLLSRDIGSAFPELLKPSAIELRDALDSKLINSIEIWYVHNCNESKNVQDELASVEFTAKNAINAQYRDSGCNEVKAIEVGLETLENWYKKNQATILVGDTFVIDIPGGYYVQGNQWKAFATTVPAEWLYKLYKDYQTKVFSANVRDYLGSRKTDGNINNGIKQSAANQPDRFWAFNNGISALVNDLNPSEDNKKITIKGISVVNGAQTIGAIGSLENPPEKTATVVARFIKCTNNKIVQDIVRYNNSQNKIASADFRSTDTTQERLRTEFRDNYHSVTYLGGRRGGVEDIIPRRQNLIPSDTTAQSLAAFHGKPVIAYAQKGYLWEDNAEYSSIFSDATHADHIVFVYSLHSTITNIKLLLMNKERKGVALTEKDKETLKFLRLRGSTFILMAAIGTCMETILDRVVPSLFLLRFKELPGIDVAESIWKPIVQCTISFRDRLKKPLDKGLGLRSNKEVEEAIRDFKSLIEATQDGNKSTYAEFANKVLSIPWSAHKQRKRKS